VLVTGGSGVLGRAVVGALLAGGHRVRVLDLLEPPARRRDSPGTSASRCRLWSFPLQQDGCRTVVAV